MESILTYEQVYRDYDRKVMGYIRPRINNPSDAEELHSAVFMKVFEKFSSFDQTKASISTWIYTIARNTLIDFFRTRKVMDELGDEDIVEEDAFQGILDEETLEKGFIECPNCGERLEFDLGGEDDEPRTDDEEIPF